MLQVIMVVDAALVVSVFSTGIFMLVRFAIETLNPDNQ